jgi:hypothetical protein
MRDDWGRKDILLKSLFVAQVGAESWGLLASFPQMNSKFFLESKSGWDICVQL